MGPVTGLICGLYMLVRVEALDQDKDGTWRHSLVTDRAQAKVCENSENLVRFTVKIPHSSKEKLANEGESVIIKADAKCYAFFGIDESFKQFWAYYRVWLCEATKLEKYAG